MRRASRASRARSKSLYAELHLRVRGARVGRRRASRSRRSPRSSRPPARGFRRHNWRSAAAGNSGGWQVARTLFLVNALLGAVATEGGVFPNAWNKFVPKPDLHAAAPAALERADVAARVSAGDERAVVPAPAFSEGRARQGRRRISRASTTRSGRTPTASPGSRRCATRADRLHVALTPTWNETAYFADYVLPMGHGSERHDIHSYETHDAQWLGFRQPVLRAARERMGETVERHARGQPRRGVGGERVLDRADVAHRPRRRARHPQVRRVARAPRRASDRRRVLRLHLRALRAGSAGARGRRGADAARVHAPLRRVRDRPQDRRAPRAGGARGRAGGRAHRSLRPRLHATPKPASPNIVPIPTPDADAEGRRLVGVEVDGKILRGFPTPSGRLEFYSTTLAEWGWHEYARPRVHQEPRPPGQAGRRSDRAHLDLPPAGADPHARANAKWLDEIAHTNPLWIHPRRRRASSVWRPATWCASRPRSATSSSSAWVTEGIRPGVVACSHHMGRWKLAHDGRGSAS